MGLYRWKNESDTTSIVFKLDMLLPKVKYGLLKIHEKRETITLKCDSSMK